MAQSGSIMKASFREISKSADDGPVFMICREEGDKSFAGPRYW